MNRAVMRAAERDGELIAHFAAERPRLQVAKMMRVGLLAAAHETRLLANIAKMLPVAIAPWCRNEEHAFVNAVGLIEVAVSFRERFIDANKTRVSCSSGVAGDFRGCGRCELRQPMFKGILHQLGIGTTQLTTAGLPLQGEVIEELV